MGLVKEPFVGGADTMIDVATAQIPNAEQGFLAVFSANYFPNAQIVLRSREKLVGIAFTRRDWRVTLFGIAVIIGKKGSISHYAEPK